MHIRHTHIVRQQQATDGAGLFSAAAMYFTLNISRSPAQTSRHPTVSSARASRLSGFMSQLLSVTLRWSLNLFFWPPTDRRLCSNCPYIICRGSLDPGILMM